MPTKGVGVMKITLLSNLWLSISCMNRYYLIPPNENLKFSKRVWKTTIEPKIDELSKISSVPTPKKLVGIVGTIALDVRSWSVFGHKDNSSS